MPTIEKVKAHTAGSEVPHDEVLVWKIKGNALADKLAKKGANDP